MTLKLLANNYLNMNIVVLKYSKRGGFSPVSKPIKGYIWLRMSDRDKKIYIYNFNLLM